MCGLGFAGPLLPTVPQLPRAVAANRTQLPALCCPGAPCCPCLQTMRQLNHPNLLPLYCSFVHKEHLWMVMPYVQGGSILNIMRFAYPDVHPACCDRC